MAKRRSGTQRKRALRTPTSKGLFWTPGAPGKPTVAIYARCSTAEQQTLDAQIEQLRKHAEYRGWSVVCEVQETGSGADAARPLRDELIRAALRRKCDHVLVWRLDRWSRSTKDALETAERLLAHGVGFSSLQEQLDLSTSTGRVMFTVITAFAQLERDTQKERQRLGIRAAKERGVRFGRPALDDATQAQVRSLAAQGVPKLRIAKQLGIARQSVYSILAAASAA